MRLFRPVLLTAALALSPGSAAGAVNVMVSFQPLYDIATRVAGEKAHVERAAPLGASPHTFDPTVRDIRRIKDAHLAVTAGLGADAWLNRYVKASGSQATVLSLGDTMTFMRRREGQATDPHWWLDASLMARAARRIGEELARLDPANAATYRKNAAAESQSLLVLHTELQKTLAGVKGAKLVTFHNAFGYFARAYGLNVVATLAPMHDVEPSVQNLVRAVQTIRQTGAKAVFAEPQLPPGPARTVAQEAGVPLFTLDPEGSAQNPTYAGMMRFNRDALLRAFAGQEGQ